MPKKKYYKTEFKTVILSEEPIEDMALKDMHYAVDEGPCCLHAFEVVKTHTLNGPEAVEALYEAGSAPGFFQLDDAGVSLLDEETL